MLSTRTYRPVPAAERTALQEQVTTLFLSFFDQLQAGPAGPWLELDLTMPRLKMLFVVDWLGPLAMSQLAAQLGISLPTATGLIDRLVEARLARREHDDRDRRVVRVCSTEAGRSLVIRLRSAGRQRLERVLDHLSEDDLQSCVVALQSINGAAEAELQTEQTLAAALAAAAHAEARE